MKFDLRYGLVVIFVATIVCSACKTRNFASSQQRSLHVLDGETNKFYKFDVFEKRVRLLLCQPRTEPNAKFYCPEILTSMPFDEVKAIMWRETENIVTKRVEDQNLAATLIFWDPVKGDMQADMRFTLDDQRRLSEITSKLRTKLEELETENQADQKSGNKLRKAWNLLNSDLLATKNAKRTGTDSSETSQRVLQLNAEIENLEAQKAELTSKKGEIQSANNEAQSLLQKNLNASKILLRALLIPLIEAQETIPFHVNDANLTIESNAQNNLIAASLIVNNAIDLSVNVEEVVERLYSVLLQTLLDHQKMEAQKEALRRHEEAARAIELETKRQIELQELEFKRQQQLAQKEKERAQNEADHQVTLLQIEAERNDALRRIEYAEKAAKAKSEFLGKHISKLRSRSVVDCSYGVSVSYSNINYRDRSTYENALIFVVTTPWEIGVTPPSLSQNGGSKVCSEHISTQTQVGGSIHRAIVRWHVAGNIVENKLKFDADPHIYAEKANMIKDLQVTLKELMPPSSKVEVCATDASLLTESPYPLCESFGTAQ